MSNDRWEVSEVWYDDSEECWVVTATGGDSMSIQCDNEIQMARICCELVRQQVTFTANSRGDLVIILTGGY